MDLQIEINDEYPPTHTFTIDTLKPTDVLKERVDLINLYFPDFFKGERLLDVGCSKGFFSLSNSANFKEIVGIDSDKRSIEICDRLNKSDNVKFLHVSFRNFTTNKKFDRIFIGNGPHHLFREIDGHEWIAKLAAISEGQVLVEGPINTKCRDFKHFPKHFNDFMFEMDKYFKLLRMFPTVRYTPGRFLILWTRRDSKIEEATNTIKKKYKKDDYVENNQIDIFIASTSPISNPVVAFTEDGWTEEFIRSPLYVYFENEKELFKLHCDHQVYLSKIGYYDMDSATINFFKTSNIMFDKSAVMPISKITEHHVDGYFKLLNQSYRTILEEVKDKIREALQSKDSVKIEEAFKWAKGDQ